MSFATDNAPRRWLMMLALLASVAGTASAQARCVPSGGTSATLILVHGINADGGTWESFENVLAPQIANAICRPTLGADRPLADQAQTLSDMYAGSGPVVLIAHSQGGLISREASKRMAVQGIITVGTPHYAAPIALHEPDIRWLANETTADWYAIADAWNARWNYEMMNYDLGNFDAFNTVEYWMMRNALAIKGFTDLALGGLIDQFMHRQPSLQDVGGATGFISQLNDPANIAREASAIPVRVGIVSAAQDFPEYAGPFALTMSPFEAVNTMHSLEVWGWYEIEYGYEALVTSSWYDEMFWYDMLAGSAAIDMGTNAVTLPGTWCGWIDGCGGDAGDFIVPTTRQVYPGGDLDFMGNGPIHTRETNDGFVAARIRNILSSRLGI